MANSLSWILFVPLKRKETGVHVHLVRHVQLAWTYIATASVTYSIVKNARAGAQKYVSQTLPLTIWRYIYTPFYPLQTQGNWFTPSKSWGPEVGDPSHVLTEDP